MNKLLVFLSVFFGILIVILALIYFLNPASALPKFIPGYQAGLMRHHYTHGVGALVLGLGAFVFAWFQSGKKSSH